jgi:branched-chain amino acid transport system permease protein
VDYLFSIGIFAAIWAVLVLSLNVLLGYGGQVSLGHAALFGVGAYTAAVAATRYELGFLPALLAALVVTAAVGAVIGLPSLRVKHDFLVLVTIGINFIFIGVVAYTDFLGGTLGIVGIPQPSLGGRPLENWEYFLLCLVVLAAVMYLTSRLPRTWGGLGLIGLRDDEEAASAVGVDPARYKIVAFALAGAIAGVGGALYAPFVGNVSPGRFSFLESVTLMSMLIFGGVGTVRGAVFGAVVLKTLPEVLRGFNEYRFAAYGMLLLLSIVFMPQGVLGRDSWLGRRLDRWLGRAEVGQVPAGRAPAAARPARVPRRAAGTTHAELAIEGVTVDFGGLRALNGVSLRVRSGEVLGLLGPNGAGKTTLFNAIVGAVPLTSGRVVLGGEEIQRLRTHATVARGVARTFQIVRPFQSLTVAGNVLAGIGAPEYPRLGAFWRPNARGAGAAREVVEEVGLAELADVRSEALPAGLLRRLEVGRALATGAGVLLLDEPAAGLTHAEAEELAAEIRRIADAGKAVVLVEHNMRFALGLCDRVAVLASGELIAEGTPEEIVKDQRVIAAYLGEEPL